MSVVAGLYQMLCAHMHMGRGGATWVGVALSMRIASELSTPWGVATKEAEQARQTTQRPNKQLPQGPASNTAMEDRLGGVWGRSTWQRKWVAIPWLAQLGMGTHIRIW